MLLTQTPYDQKKADPKYRVERHGVWRIRLVAVKPKASGRARDREAERKMYQARIQLRKSQELREGKNVHQGGLRSGQEFTKHLRRQQQHKLLDLDEDYLREYDERWIHQQRQEYLGEKYMEFAESLQEDLPLPQVNIS